MAFSMGLFQYYMSFYLQVKRVCLFQREGAGNRKDRSSSTLWGLSKLGARSHDELFHSLSFRFRSPPNGKCRAKILIDLPRTDLDPCYIHLGWLHIDRTSQLMIPFLRLVDHNLNRLCLILPYLLFQRSHHPLVFKLWRFRIEAKTKCLSSWLPFSFNS